MYLSPVIAVYDEDLDCVRVDEKYIARCAACGREMLKKRMVTLLARQSYANPKTIGHFCPDCFASLCGEYELKDGGVNA